jgi:hypothetical protein
MPQAVAALQQAECNRREPGEERSDDRQARERIDVGHAEEAVTRAAPASARASPASTLIRVVLPAPFGPSRPKNSPRAISRSMPASAGIAP